MSQLNSYIGYVSAWITYAGEILTKIGSLGSVIRDSFDTIKKPVREDFFNK